MKKKIKIDSVYVPSEDVVAREIQGEFILIPIVSGIAGVEDELFSLNETGKAIWDKLDGKKSLRDVTQELLNDFEAPAAKLKADVLGWVDELAKRKILAKVK